MTVDQEVYDAVRYYGGEATNLQLRRKLTNYSYNTISRHLMKMIHEGRIVKDESEWPPHFLTVGDRP